MDATTAAPVPSVDGLQAAHPTGAHRRTYQACIPCRKRKVRCDLGPVDDPHDPPCQRCRRESKECYFSATRRKRRASSGEDDIREVEQHGESPVVYNVRRKSARGSGTFQSGPVFGQGPQHSIASGSTSSVGVADDQTFGKPGRYESPNQYIPDAAVGRIEDGQDQEVTNETAAALFQSPINTPGDALHLLLQASGQSEEIGLHKDLPQPQLGPDSRHQRYNTSASNHAPSFARSSHPPAATANTNHIDPAITNAETRHNETLSSRDVLAVYSRLRFVRAGWLTAREALSYMDYFYQYLAPLTPVSPPDLRDFRHHPDLLSEEPMLTVTLLTVASRYMQLSGPGGKTRSYMIHERLWQSLQSMITRMFWGQEQYGGGFCGSGARKRGSRPTERGGLRTLGTIESLLILSDFHPRAMHFPPAGDDEDIMAPAVDPGADSTSVNSEGPDTPGGGSSTLLGWTEPALRSDRMTWSLIGLSHALAYELGIFGTYSDGIQTVDGRVKRQGGPLKYYVRADRIERLLYIYITQACGRFGFPSFYSDHVNKFNLSVMDRGYSSVDSLMTQNQSPADVIQEYWVEMAAINKACNDSLFPSKDQTAMFIQTGEYERRLQQLQPIIVRWQEKFAASKVAKYPKLALLIDLHYFRLYINGLALQAVLEQWTTKVGEVRQGDSPQTPGSSISSSFATMFSRNEPYIKEVIDASRTILRHVVYDLLPDDYLKHAPVRMYFRIVSASMFLLKTFALGGRLDEVRTSLHLLEQTIRALRTSVVDDVHLCLRIADLLEGLTSSIGSKFVRLPPQARSSSRGTPTTTLRAPVMAAGQDVLPRHLGYAVGMPDPMSGIPNTHTDPRDGNIAIMPPPGGSYAKLAYPNDPHQPNQAFPTTSQSLPQQQDPNFVPGENSTSLPFPSEEDWLTLDLQSLIDNQMYGATGTNGVEGDGTGEANGSMWYGAFGPETHNNLEVLGKLVNEQWAPGDLAF